MEEWKIPLYKIYTDDEDVQLITKIIKRGRNWALGPEIEEFEKLLKNYVGCDYCLTLNSGTSALHSSLIAHEISKDDEVIVPSFSFISTANSVMFVDAKPVFSDIEEETFGIDPKLLEKKITKKTKAILPMDYGGMSCKIFELKKIANENNLLLIEDAAECLGSSVKGKKTGSVADTSIFSFCGNKVLTTGEGGAIVTNSKEIFEKIKLIRSHGRTDSKNYFENSSQPNYLNLGYNWRMSTITATLGISQLQKLDKIIKMRQNNAAYISERLQKINQLKVPLIPKDYNHIFQMYTIRLKDNKIRESLKKFLHEKKIFAKVYFDPIHLTKFYLERFPDLNLEVTSRVSQEILTLPMYPNMTSEEKNYLIDSIFEFFEKKS